MTPENEFIESLPELYRKRTHSMVHVCPFCETQHDLATCLYDDALAPAAGDVSFCIDCGEYSMFDSAAPGSLRKPTHEEYEMIVGEEKFSQIREKWREVEK